MLQGYVGTSTRQAVLKSLLGCTRQVDIIQRRVELLFVVVLVPEDKRMGTGIKGGASMVSTPPAKSTPRDSSNHNSNSTTLSILDAVCVIQPHITTSSYPHTLIIQYVDHTCRTR